MLRYALRRCGWTVVQLAALSVIVFLLTDLLPGDAATVDFNEQAGLDQVARLREQMGLDRPLTERFADWAHGLLTGDLGTSLVGGGPVSEVLSSSVGVTAALAAMTILFLVPLAVAVGLLTGLRADSRTDRVISAVTLTLTSVPDFVLALLLVGLFALRLGWLPSTWVGADDVWWQRPELFVLPMTVLLARTVCVLSRQIRAGTITALHAGYTVQARRLGVPPARLLLWHVLPNAAVPGVQELARTGDQLLGGVLVIEAVFAVPGTATALVEAVQNRDVPTVQALTLALATVACLLNLGADLVGQRLAPRTEVLR
ncbi:ABC transporter permease [Streptomyces shenzhenensis]